MSGTECEPGAALGYEIFIMLPSLLPKPRFMTAKYAVLMTGPSANADIEGVLVRGAQGIRSLKLIPAPRGTHA
jgi:hypothetical protein